MITLADGTQEKIGKIVNQRMPVEVLSYDPDADAVVPKKIVNWFDNGVTDEFLQFTVAKPGGQRTRASSACTPNHQIRTPGGWREAQELAVGDRVLQSVPHHLSDFQWEVVLGGLMGDGALSPTRTGHGCDGSASVMAPSRRSTATGRRRCSRTSACSRSTNAKGAVFCDVSPLPELAELRRAVYVEGKKVFGHDYLKQLTPLSLAVWYMDDGGFTLRAKGVQERTRDGSGRSEICVEAMEPTTRTRLVAYLRDTWDISPKLSSSGGGKVAFLVVPEGRDGEAARAHRAVRAPVDGVQAAPALPRAVRGRAVLRTDALRADGVADHEDRGRSRRRVRCTASTSRWRARTTTSPTA